MPRTLIYILIMAIVTYLIRVLPLALIRKEIKNRTLKSFLYYVPYVTLAVMTFPAILYTTDSVVCGLIGFIVALAAAFLGFGLLPVAASASIAVLIIQIVTMYF